MSLCSCLMWWKKKTPTGRNNDDIELTNANRNNQRSNEPLVADDRRGKAILNVDDQNPNSTLKSHDDQEYDRKGKAIMKIDDQKGDAPLNIDTNAVPSSSEPIAFKPEELALATNNYSSKLGEGGYGPVYKGTLTRNNHPMMVAVKTLNRDSTQGYGEFLMETVMLSNLRHPNLVQLIGFCDKAHHRMLVYEYMHHGSLADHLDDPVKRNSLNWKKRMRIAADVARALQYLHAHAKMPVIYRDMKPDNILLDDHFNAKLSDFGMAKMGPTGDQTHVSTRIMGTYGYCAPEYAKTGKLTFKSDVFGFGIVLLELISGRPAIYPAGQRGKTETILEWALPIALRKNSDLTELVDPMLEGQYRRASVSMAASMAMLCVRELPYNRPTMVEVVKCFDTVVAHLDEPPDSGRRGGSAGPSTSSGGASGKEKAVALDEAKRWGQTYRDNQRPFLPPEYKA